MIRIIGGTSKGRQLKVPPGHHIRPTANKVREALFNILQPYILESTFLDLFAGCGGVGIEALSRGAARVTFVEENAAHLRILRENLSACKLLSRAVLLRGECLSLARTGLQPCDIVFADPPYAFDQHEELLHLLIKHGILTKFMIYEHPRKKVINLAAMGRTLGVEMGLTPIKSYTYGDSCLSLFERTSVL